MQKQQQFLHEIYEKRGESLFNKVSSKFIRLEDSIQQIKDQADALISGIGSIRREALAKVQFIILDNHPRHGLPEVLGKIKKQVDKQQDAVYSKQESESIVEDIAEKTFDVIEKKITSFMEMISSKVDHVTARLDQLIKQAKQKNVFRSNFDNSQRNIVNRDEIWLDYDGISLKQNGTLLFEKSTKTAFNKIDSAHTRDITIESEQGRDGECTIIDIRNALESYCYTPTYLEIRLSYWQFSIFEDENRYVTSLCETLKSLPALQVLHLDISKMKSDQNESELDLFDESLFKLADTFRSLKLLEDLSLNFEHLQSSLTSEGFDDIIHSIKQKRYLKHLTLNFNEWCTLNAEISSFESIGRLCTAFKSLNLLQSLDLSLLSFQIDYSQMEEMLLQLPQLSELTLSLLVLSYEDPAYLHMLKAIASQMILTKCTITSESAFSEKRPTIQELLLAQKAACNNKFIQQFQALNKLYEGFIRKEILWDTLALCSLPSR